MNNLLLRGFNSSYLRCNHFTLYVYFFAIYAFKCFLTSILSVLQPGRYINVSPLSILQSVLIWLSFERIFMIEHQNLT